MGTKTETKANAQATKAEAKTGQSTKAKANKATAPKKDKAVVETPAITLPTLAETPKETVKFESMCGSDFDVNQASTCWATCQEDNPEAFAACKANHALVGQTTKVKATRTSRGKTLWLHLKGCQGGLVDEILSEVKGPHSIEDIMKYSDGTRARVTGHMRHLTQKRGVVLRMTEEGKIFAEGFNDEGLTGIRTDSIKLFNEDGTAFVVQAVVNK